MCTVCQSFLMILSRGCYNYMQTRSSPIVCRRAHVLCTLFVVLLCLVVSNIYCVVYCLVFLRLLYPYMLPVSLDCPFLIAHSVFSNVYSRDVPEYCKVPSFVFFAPNSSYICSWLHIFPILCLWFVTIISFTPQLYIYGIEIVFFKYVCT